MPAPLDEFAAAVLSLRRTISEARDAQWRPSHTPQPREDTTERATGGHGDPTLATVIDDHRVALRTRVEAAERVLRDAASFVRRTDEALSQSLDRWAGDDPLLRP